MAERARDLVGARDAGAGDDNVSYRGGEILLDGGTGSNTLVLRSAALVDLAATDATVGDATNVIGFSMFVIAVTLVILAQVIGKSRSHVANTLRLMKLPEDVRSMVSRGDRKSTRLNSSH